MACFACRGANSNSPIADAWAPLPLSSYAAEIKLAHVAAVVLSGALFFARGMLMLAGRQARAMATPVRYLSYSIDSIMLLAALLLLALLPAAVYGNGWLWVKLLLLPLYVVLGWLALHKAAMRAVRFGFFTAAVLTYLMMASIARAHHPLGWLGPWLDRQGPAVVSDTPAVAADCLGKPVSVPPPTGDAGDAVVRALRLDERAGPDGYLPRNSARTGLPAASTPLNSSALMAFRGTPILYLPLALIS